MVDGPLEHLVVVTAEDVAHGLGDLLLILLGEPVVLSVIAVFPGVVPVALILLRGQHPDDLLGLLHRPGSVVLGIVAEIHDQALGQHVVMAERNLHRRADPNVHPVICKIGVDTGHSLWLYTAVAIFFHGFPPCRLAAALPCEGVRFGSPGLPVPAGRHGMVLWYAADFGP